MRTRQYESGRPASPRLRSPTSLDDYDYEEYEFYFGRSANCIDKPNHEYGWIPEHRDIEVTVILSSNYTDLYLLVKGDHKFQLPHKVDIKYEENIDPNPNEIVREYQLVLNKHNHDETTLQFAERHFKQLDVNYIILLKEFDTNYEDFITPNYSFVMDSRNNMPDLNSKTHLHIYYAFDKNIFMNEWDLVELKEPNDICITRDFRHSTKGLINTQDNFISVLNRTTYSSPVLTCSTKRTSLEDRLRLACAPQRSWTQRGSRERSSDLRESAKPTLLKFSPYVDEVKKVPEAKLRIAPEPILKPSRFPVDQHERSRSDTAEDEELRKRSKEKVYSPGEFMNRDGFPGSAGKEKPVFQTQPFSSILPEMSSSESMQDDVESRERSSDLRESAKPKARTNQGGGNIIPEPNNQTGTVWTNPLRSRFTRNNDQSTAWGTLIAQALPTESTGPSKNNSRETGPEKSNRHPTFSHPGHGGKK